jgi:hypothetical protein
MGVDSKAFANDPHSNEKRNDMIRSARALLSAVTRLLCIADMADVYRLLASLRLVSNFETNSVNELQVYIIQQEVRHFERRPCVKDL